MTMTTAERKTVREQLHLLKPAGFKQLADDASNLDDIVAEYDKLYKIGRELIVIEDRALAEGLATQGQERQFFGYCASLLRSLLKVLELKLAKKRGEKYGGILAENPRDLNDRAINSIIDGDDEVFDLHMQVISVREYVEKFNDLVESYNQRGYALNNLTRAMSDAIAEMIVNEQ